MPEVFEAFIEFKEGIFTKNPIYDAMVFIFFGFFSLCAAVLGPQVYIDYLNRSNARPSIGQELQPVNQPSNNPSNPISEPPPVNTADPCCSYHHAPAVTVCEDDDIIEPFPLPDSNPCPFLDSHPRPLPGSDLNQYSKIIAAINGYVLVLSLTFYEFFEGITLQLPASLERAW